MMSPGRSATERLEEHLQAGLLIVDDDEASVQLLEHILQRAGYTNLRGVTDPREALPLFDGFQPDIVLLDLVMPQLDGFALMDELRSRVPEGGDLPILVLTVDITPDVKRRSLSAGANDFLTKPFDQVEVLLRIRNLLKAHFLHVRLRKQNEILEATVQERTADIQKSLDDLRRVDDQRRRLLARLVKAQEEERRRIAADIHDDPIQKMTAVGLRLQILRGFVAEPEGTKALDALDETVRQAIGRLRYLLFELRPPALDREGLAAAITDYLEQTSAETGLDVRVENRLTTEPPLEIRAIAYRITQEALSNVRKHARAEHVQVLLETREEGLYVRVRDDGVGIGPDPSNDPRPGHLGLRDMRERAELSGGWYRVEGTPGRGTTVEFWLPIQTPEGVAQVAR